MLDSRTALAKHTKTLGVVAAVSVAIAVIVELFG
jgi:hypothetical protein